MWKIIWNYLGITLGTFITALGLVLFLVPNKIAAGGVSGLATVIYYVFKFKVGLTMLALNIPLFLFGLKEMGIRFGLKTLYGTVTLSFFIDLISPYLKPPTHDLLLASIYGGIVTGLGLGIVFKFGGTTGGTDLAARIIHRYLKLSVGQSLLLIDASVIALAAMVFNVELALYAFLVVFLTAKVIDLVQEGEGFAKAALVVSDKNKEIGEQVMRVLDRGVTYLQGRGGFTGQNKEVLLVVVSRSEVSRLKQLVAKTDPKAFVIVASVNEALGEGFKNFGTE
ncbi:YitT family protein [Zhaonella formicivorans]|uniref:YitT family protein n=1 Tax=Zhaonella formicivorans TaxID=2528593 RepID=UPI001D11EA08|nr:YitT family protein [Zhaonella formicivorans]